VSQLVGVAGLLRVVKNVNNAGSDTFRRMLAKAGKKVSCTPGCAYCCYPKIVCSIVDAVPVYLYLHLTDAWTPELQAKLAEADRAMTAATHARYLRERRPCAFLREEEFGRGHCSVYPVRPICCVGTFSDRNPPECGDPDATSKLLIVKHEKIDEHMMDIGRSILETLRLRRVFLYTFPGAVLTAAALCERQPLPDVHQLEITEDTEPGSTETRFDEVATTR
jgi:hypothetical protein